MAEQEQASQAQTTQQQRDSLEEMIRRAQDTISGLRGNLQQTRAEKQELEQERDRILNENKQLQAQLQEMMAKVNEISEVIPELARRARRADRLEKLSKHPELMTVEPLRNLLLEADLPDDKLDTYTEQLAETFNELFIGEPEESSTEKESEEEGSAESKGAEQSPNETESGAAETQETQGETEGASTEKENKIPPGPPAMNSSTFAGGTTSIQQMIDEAIRAGDLDAVQRLTVEHLMGDVNVSLLADES